MEIGGFRHTFEAHTLTPVSPPPDHHVVNDSLFPPHLPFRDVAPLMGQKQQSQVTTDRNDEPRNSSPQVVFLRDFVSNEALLTQNSTSWVEKQLLSDLQEMETLSF